MQPAPQKPVVLITGVSNLLGQILCEGLQHRYRVIAQTHDQTLPATNNIQWVHDLAQIKDTIHGVICLAGKRPEFVRWTGRRKQQLISHRRKEIHDVAKFLKHKYQQPDTFIVESSTHYYGARKDKRMFECGTRQGIYLSQLFSQWEDATSDLPLSGTRVVQMRIGLVMSNKDGVLPRCHYLLNAGLGLKFDAGHQWVPWIHEQDLVDLFHLALTNPRVTGPMNACSAHPVQQFEFIETLRQCVGSGVVASMPGAFLRWSLGEKAQLMTNGQRALPGEALKHGFVFKFKHLQAALEDLVGTSRTTVATTTPILQPNVPPEKVPAKL